MKFFKFIFNIFYYLDLGLNMVLLGDPSETVSSRLGRALQSGNPKWFVPPFAYVVDLVFYRFFGQIDHSLTYIEYDENFEHELWSWIK